MNYSRRVLRIPGHEGPRHRHPSASRFGSRHRRSHRTSGGGSRSNKPPSRGIAALVERVFRSGRHDGHRRCRAHPAGRRRDDPSRRRPPGPTVKASAIHPVLPAALKALPWKDVPSTAAVEPLTCSTGGARSNRRTELTRAPACAGSHSRRTRSAGPLVTCTRHLGAQSD